MRFLFRTPLFDLDPSSIEEIEQNWPKVLNAIQYSSSDFYLQIKDSQFQELTSFQQKKIYKYLLRGRYRATPFGYWAGVGIGSFEEIEKKSLDLFSIENLETLGKSQFPEDSYTYCVSLEGYENLGRVQYLGFLQEEERWAFVSIAKNPLSEKLREVIQTGNVISYSTFRNWYPEWTDSETRDLWSNLIKLGVLQKILKGRSDQPIDQASVDLIVNDSISLPKKCSRQLEELWETGGNLFAKTKNHFLASFEKWFQFRFDDRFVPLPFLLNYPDFVHHLFLDSHKINGENFQAWDFLRPTKDLDEVVDLRKQVSPSPISSSVYDLNFLVRVCQEDKLILENILCNRPFSYFGRFNRDQKVFNHQSILRKHIFQENEVLYAELKIVESRVVQGICDTSPLFDWYISPFIESDPFAIALDDLELGFRESQFFLYHRKKGIRVIPVITHPLNGKEISHPLIRLLWELDQGHPFKFIVFQSQITSPRAYTPQFQWGDFILQCRKWRIESGWFKGIDELKKWLDKNQIPDPVKIGIYDRELILSRGNSMDCMIFWNELQKNKKLTLTDPVWLKGSPFRSLRTGRMIFPELAINLSRKMPIEKWDGFVNSAETQDQESLYIMIRVLEDDLDGFLEFYFNLELRSYLEIEGILWYFLIYPEDSQIQIRVRFLKLTPSKREQLILLCFVKKSDCVLDQELRPYYPERKKYGKETIQISERLFHLESNLVLKWRGQFESEEIDIDFFKKISITLWRSIFLKAFTRKSMLGFLKGKVKKLSFQEKNKLLAEGYPQEEEIPKNLVDWINDYSRIMDQILEVNTSEDERIRILSHHIHMQANRFFLMKSRHFENWIYMQLYRFIGRDLFMK